VSCALILVARCSLSQIYQRDRTVRSIRTLSFGIEKDDADRTCGGSNPCHLTGGGHEQHGDVGKLYHQTTHQLPYLFKHDHSRKMQEQDAKRAACTGRQKQQSEAECTCTSRSSTAEHRSGSSTVLVLQLGSFMDRRTTY
jgi:hypothetical protein